MAKLFCKLITNWTCSLIVTDRRFRTAYCLPTWERWCITHRLDEKSKNYSETSVNFYRLQGETPQKTQIFTLPTRHCHSPNTNTHKPIFVPGTSVFYDFWKSQQQDSLHLYFSHHIQDSGVSMVTGNEFPYHLLPIAHINNDSYQPPTFEVPIQRRLRHTSLLESSNEMLLSTEAHDKHFKAEW
jgi:hypothetical protein